MRAPCIGVFDIAPCVRHAREYIQSLRVACGVWPDRGIAPRTRVYLCRAFVPAWPVCEGLSQIVVCAGLARIAVAGLARIAVGVKAGAARETVALSQIVQREVDAGPYRSRRERLQAAASCASWREGRRDFHASSAGFHASSAGFHASSDSGTGQQQPPGSSPAMNVCSPEGLTASRGHTRMRVGG